MPSFWRRALLGGCLCWFSAVSVLAQAPPPIEIFAERVDVNLKAHSSRFSGQVRVLFEPYQAQCDVAEVYLDAKTRQVIKMVLQGNVTLKQQNAVLKGQRITLDVRQNRLQIEGQVYTRFQLERPVNLNLN